jgi:hypothetical protein
MVVFDGDIHYFHYFVYILYFLQRLFKLPYCVLNSAWLSVHRYRISAYQVSITLHVNCQWHGFFMYHVMSLGTLTAVTHVKSVPCSNTSCSVNHTVSRRTREIRRVRRRASDKNFEHSKDFSPRIHSTQMQSVWTYWKMVYYKVK